MPRAFLIILDGVGVGGADDAVQYGDLGSDTLGNLAKKMGGLTLPNLQLLGLGNTSEIDGVSPIVDPVACYGRLIERSAGKDSVTGHWEICGVHTEIPFPTYETAFPKEVVDLVERIGGKPVIGNEVASGTEIIARLGDEHCRTGHMILYTSADSVLQLAAHEGVVPVEELYRVCHDVHEHLPREHRVARIIARPFEGPSGAYTRTVRRKDYAVEPTGDTILDHLQENGFPVQSIGKVDTLFAGRGFTATRKTKNNADGILAILESIRDFENGLIFANLIDFDQQWGHRNDCEGFTQGLEELDSAIPSWLAAASDKDLFIVTADHGNDPTTPSTDHSREHVPLLAWMGSGKNGVDLGIRNSFSDIAATIAEHFQVEWNGHGQSFYRQLPA